MERQDKLNILYRSKVIKEMTLEDLEIWEGFEKIYPSCLRFPESVEWNWNSTLRNKKNCIKLLNDSLKRINQYIGEISGFKVTRCKSDKKLSLFMKKQEEILESHLRKLKEIRNKRLNEKLEILPKNKLKKMKKKVLSNSSPPVRTSDKKSDFDKSKEFNTDLKEVSRRQSIKYNH